MHFGIQRVSSTLTAVCIRWVCKSFSRLQIILMLLSASLHFSALVPQEYQVSFLSAHKPSVQQFLLVFARDRCQAILSICVLRKHQMLTAQTRLILQPQIRCSCGVACIGEYAYLAMNSCDQACNHFLIRFNMWRDVDSFTLQRQ